MQNWKCAKCKKTYAILELFRVDIESMGSENGPFFRAAICPECLTNLITGLIGNSNDEVPNNDERIDKLEGHDYDGEPNERRFIGV